MITDLFTASQFHLSSSCSMPPTRKSNRTTRPGAVLLKRPAAKTKNTTRPANTKASSNTKTKNTTSPDNTNASSITSTQDKTSGPAKTVENANDLLHIFDFQIKALEKRLEDKLLAQTSTNPNQAASSSLVSNVSTTGVGVVTTAKDLTTEARNGGSEDEDDIPLMGSRAINSLLLGGEITHDPVSQKFSSVDVPLGATVSPKLKEKIWSNKFVEFDQLLVQSPTEFSFKMSQSPQSSPTLSLQSSNKSRSEMSVNAWVSAFLIYGSILTEKSPQHAPALFKYCATIRRMSERRMNWRFYDREFRVLHNGASPPWGTIHQELYLESAFPASERDQSFRTKSYNTGRRGRQNSQKQYGFCWRAQESGGRCSQQDCKFKHACAHCSQDHPSNRCTKATGTKQPNYSNKRK